MAATQEKAVIGSKVSQKTLEVATARIANADGLSKSLLTPNLIASDSETTFNVQSVLSMAEVLNSTVSTDNMRYSENSKQEYCCTEQLTMSSSDSDASTGEVLDKVEVDEYCVRVLSGNNQSTWEPHTIRPENATHHAASIVRNSGTMSADTTSVTAMSKNATADAIKNSASIAREAKRAWQRHHDYRPSTGTDNVSGVGFAANVYGKMLFHNAAVRYDVGSNGVRRSMTDDEPTLSNTFLCTPMPMQAIDGKSVITPAPQAMGDNSHEVSRSERVFQQALAMLTSAHVYFVSVEVRGLNANAARNPIVTLTPHGYGDHWDNNPVDTMMQDIKNSEDCNQNYLLYKDPCGQVWYAVQAKYLFTRPRTRRHDDQQPEGTTSYYVDALSNCRDALAFLLGRPRVTEDYLPGTVGFLNRLGNRSYANDNCVSLALAGHGADQGDWSMTKQEASTCAHGLLRAYGLTDDTFLAAFTKLMQVNSVSAVIDENNGAISPPKYDVRIPPIIAYGIQNAPTLNGMAMTDPSQTGTAGFAVRAIAIGGMLIGLGASLWSTAFKLHSEGNIKMPSTTVFTLSADMARGLRFQMPEQDTKTDRRPWSEQEVSPPALAKTLFVESTSTEGNLFDSIIRHGDSTATRYLGTRTLIGRRVDIVKNVVLPERAQTVQYAERLTWDGASATLPHVEIPFVSRVPQILTPAVSTIVGIPSRTNDELSAMRGELAAMCETTQVGHATMCRTTRVTRELGTAEMALRAFLSAPLGQHKALADLAKSASSDASSKHCVTAIMLAKFGHGARLLTTHSQLAAPSVELVGNWPSASVAVVAELYGGARADSVSPKPLPSSVSTSPEALRKAVLNGHLNTVLTTATRIKFCRPMERHSTTTNALSAVSSYELDTFRSTANDFTQSVVVGNARHMATPVLYHARDNVQAASAITMSSRSGLLSDVSSVAGNLQTDPTYKPLRTRVAPNLPTNLGYTRRATRENFLSYCGTFGYGSNAATTPTKPEGSADGAKDDRREVRPPKLTGNVVLTQETAEFSKALRQGVPKDLLYDVLEAITDTLNDGGSMAAVRDRPSDKILEIMKEAGSMFQWDHVNRILKATNAVKYGPITTPEGMLSSVVGMSAKASARPIVTWIATVLGKQDHDKLTELLVDDVKSGRAPRNDLRSYVPLVEWTLSTNIQRYMKAMEQLNKLAMTGADDGNRVVVYTYDESTLRKTIENHVVLAGLLRQWSEHLGKHRSKLASGKVEAHEMQIDPAPLLDSHYIANLPGIKVNGVVIPITVVLQHHKIDVAEELLGAVKLARESISMLKLGSEMDTVGNWARLSQTPDKELDLYGTRVQYRMRSLITQDKGEFIKSMTATLIMQAMYLGYLPCWISDSDKDYTGKNSIKVLINLAYEFVK